MPRIAISTGVTLDYTEAGNPHGPPIVFVHGYLDSRRIWEPALPHLPQQHRLVFVSQRGFGDADKPQAGFTQTDYVKDLEAFLGAIGIKQAVIVGHSMGGLIAHYFAVRNPAKVTRLVLVGTAPTAASSAIVGGTVMDEINMLSDPIDPGFVRLSQGEQMRTPVPDLSVRCDRRRNPEGTRTIMAGRHGRHARRRSRHQADRDQVPGSRFCMATRTCTSPWKISGNCSG